MFLSWKPRLRPADLMIGSLIISSKYYQGNLISTFHGKLIQTRCCACCGSGCITRGGDQACLCFAHVIITLWYCLFSWSKWKLKIKGRQFSLSISVGFNCSCLLVARLNTDALWMRDNGVMILLFVIVILLVRLWLLKCNKTVTLRFSFLKSWCFGGQGTLSASH